MKNVLLVFGGKSYEHDISVVTATQIFNRAKLEDIKLFPLYISRDNKFFVVCSQKLNVKDFSANSFNKKNKIFKEVAFVSGESKKVFLKTRFGLKEYFETEVAIFACHGGDGENGKLVSFFEQFAIKTSAGNALALGACMNKFNFKTLMRGLSIPTAKGFLINKTKYWENAENYKFQIQFLTFPVVIKTNNGGSSIGLFVAHNKDEFDEKLKSAFEFDNEVLVENFIEHSREFNVAILGDLNAYQISDIDEPLKPNEVLTFADKYQSSGKLAKGNKNGSMACQNRRLPADISESLEKQIKKYAEKIFVKLGLRGVVRIDFLLDEVAQKVYVCEVNAIPGSLAFYFFKQNLITSNDIVLKLIQIAENSKDESFLINQNYLTNILD